ncbi:MAG TPA: type II toxin-antitoxin system HicA family toxin [Pirellulaceae bacterium]|nr:type II toxin-antitoxin system HicA family toxin [Pirellulaceae bacterium]
MKRTELLKHLRRHGCRFVREGSSHSIWQNQANGKQTAVPRHREIVNRTARMICQQLEIPPPA